MQVKIILNNKNVTSVGEFNSKCLGKKTLTEELISNQFLRCIFMP